jgi:cysteine desulfurase
VFTGGGTESNNAALHAMLALSEVEGPRKNLAMTRVEHASVLKFGEQVERRGTRVAWLNVDGEGRLAMDELAAAIGPKTAGVSVMTANNETGVLFPVEHAARIAHDRGALFHTDAIQAAGKIPLDVRSIGADYLSLSAHKLHGPKGVGALYIRKGAPFTPLLVGGEQEQGRRAGTENVAGIVGFGKAAELAREMNRDARDRIETKVLSEVRGSRVVGRGTDRLPNTSLFLIEGIDSEALLALLDMDGILCSSGSACAAGANEPSHVLRAMSIPAALARGALRVSLSRFTTEAEAAALVETLATHVVALRKRS